MHQKNSPKKIIAEMQRKFTDFDNPDAQKMHQNENLKFADNHFDK